jgi:hypothetical protein
MTREPKLAQAEARIAELEACLAPFAREAVDWLDWQDDNYHPPIGVRGGGKARFTVGDIRRAAAKLKNQGGER